MKRTKSLLLYVHGFNSSPLSHKAMVMKTYCEKHRPDIKVVVPQLPCFPKDAADRLIQLIDQYKHEYQIGLVGSSLGGYFSIWLNAQFGYRAVVVNPAVKPYELLSHYLGPQENPYTHERYWLEPRHIDELKALDVRSIIRPHSLWLLSQTGDEVLNYREAQEKLSAAKQTIEPGGDHSFVAFERYAEEIVEFLAL
jgi:predicted esterase YcpF (UPF0227 family)